MRFRALYRLIATALLLLPAREAACQWKGEFGIEGGYGRRKALSDEEKPLKHFLEKGDMKLDYKSPRFDWNSSLSFTMENLMTDNVRVTHRADNSWGHVVRTNDENPRDLAFKTSATAKPREGAFYKTTLEYNFHKNRGTNQVLDRHFSNDWDELIDYTVYYRKPHTLSSDVKTQFEMRTPLGSERKVLQGLVALQGKFSKEDNFWANLMESGTEDEWKMESYKNRPNSNILYLSSDISFADSLIRSGALRLRLTPGARFGWGTTYDHNKEERGLINFVKDSVEVLTVKEDFDYTTIECTPYIRIDATLGKFFVHLNYGVDWYGRRLTDRNEHDSKKMDYFNPNFVGEGSVGWKPSSPHSFSFENKIEVRQPSYIQTCWYDRPGTYRKQVYRGNRSLLTEKTRRYSLRYDLNIRHIQSTTTLSTIRKVDQVEMTFMKEKIGKEDIQVFYWTNAGDSWETGVKEDFIWKSGRFYTRTSLEYQHRVQTSSNSKRTNRSNQWKLQGEGEVNLGRGWKSGASVKYQSDIASFFSIFDDYCDLGAHLQKQFGKHIAVTFKVNDILNRPRKTTFCSDDGKEYWNDSSRLNRRLFLLGARWLF